MTSCLHDGTSWNDSPQSPKISIQPKNNEKIFFFSIDTSNSQDSKYAFRQHYNLVGKLICDLIIYYVDFNRDIRRIVFTETKGNDLKHARAQLESTYTAVRDHGDYRNFCDSKCDTKIEVRLLCVSDKANNTLINSKGKRDKRAIKKKTGGNLRINEVKPKDFDTYLRGE